MKLFLTLLLVLCAACVVHASLTEPKPTLRLYKSDPPTFRKGVLSQDTLSLLSIAQFHDQVNGKYAHLSHPILHYGEGADSMMVVSREEGVSLSDFVTRPSSDGRKEQVMMLLESVPEMREAVVSLRNDLTRVFPGLEIGSFKLRVSKTPWWHGAHFDCLDGCLLQLVGERKVTTIPFRVWDSNEPTFPLYGLSSSELRKRGPCVTRTLLPGDMIEIPMYLTHAVEGTSSSKECPISICVSFDRNVSDSERVWNCNRRFGSLFPKRKVELLRGDL